MPERDKVRRYFPSSFTDRDRAIFELGIAMGSTYHQFLGTPVTSDPETTDALARAIEKTMITQPYRESVKVKIHGERITRHKKHQYDYESLKGRHLSLTIVTRYGNCRATGKVRYLPKLDYTLMHVDSLEEN
jgi:hypothetical protein